MRKIDAEHMEYSAKEVVGFGRGAQGWMQESTPNDALNGHNTSLAQKAFEQAWKRFTYKDVSAERVRDWTP